MGVAVAHGLVAGAILWTRR